MKEKQPTTKTTRKKANRASSRSRTVVARKRTNGTTRRRPRKKTSTIELAQVLTPTKSVFPTAPRSNSRVLVLALVVVVAVLYYFRGQLIVAIVNGQPIFRNKLISRMEKQVGKQTLETIITETLVLQEARKQNIDVSAEEVQTELSQVKESFAAQNQDFDQMLTLQGLTEEDILQQIKLQKMVEVLASQEVQVTEEEIDEYLELNKDFLPEDSEEEELRETTREQLVQQKRSTQIQEWLQGVQNKAVIDHWLFSTPAQ